MKQISSHFTITSHKEDGEKGQQLLSSSILEGIYPPQQGLFFSLSLRSLSFSQKVVKKYKHTCRHAIREKCVSPKEAVCEIFLHSPKRGTLSSACEQKRPFSHSLNTTQNTVLVHATTTSSSFAKKKQQRRLTRKKRTVYSEHISNSK